MNILGFKDEIQFIYFNYSYNVKKMEYFLCNKIFFTLYNFISNKETNTWDY